MLFLVRCARLSTNVNRGLPLPRPASPAGRGVARILLRRIARLRLRNGVAYGQGVGQSAGMPCHLPLEVLVRLPGAGSHASIGLVVVVILFTRQGASRTRRHFIYMHIHTYTYTYIHMQGCGRDMRASTGRECDNAAISLTDAHSRLHIPSILGVPRMIRTPTTERFAVLAG